MIEIKIQFVKNIQKILNKIMQIINDNDENKIKNQIVKNK